MQIFQLPLWLDLSAAGVGSLQGAMFAAGFKRLDLLGVAVIAISCGLGGGFIRDVLINETPASLTTNWYLLVCVGSGLIGMALQRLLVRVDPVINLFDAVALGMFAALGTTKALNAGLPVASALFIGTAAAVGGGLLRDVLLNLPIAVMHVGSFYAVAAFVGSGVLITLLHFGVNVSVAGVICVAVTTVLRLLSLFFGWSLPEQRALDRLKRRRRREVEATVEAIRTQTIQIDEPELGDDLDDPPLNPRRT